VFYSGMVKVSSLPLSTLWFVSRNIIRFIPAVLLSGSSGRSLVGWAYVQHSQATTVSRHFKHSMPWTVISWVQNHDTFVSVQLAQCDSGLQIFADFSRHLSMDTGAETIREIY
jgi:hypothetical protein